MLRVLILGIFLFEVTIYNSATVLDVILFLLNTYYLFLKKGSFKIIKNIKWLIIFYIYIFVSAIFLTDFEFTPYINRFLRFSNILLGFFLVVPNLIDSDAKKEKLVKYLKYATYLLIFSLFFEFIFNNILSYNLDLRLTPIENERIVGRLYSFFSEPSMVAIILMFLITTIYYLNEKSLNLFLLLAVLFSMIALNSLTGVAAAILFLLLQLYSSKSNKFLLTLLFFILIFSLSFLTVVTNYYVDRYSLLIENEDFSTFQRTIGSWLIPIEVLQNYYLGDGVAREPFLLEKFFGDIEGVSSINFKINNSFAYIFYENGIIGLLLFMFHLIQAYRKNIYIFCLMIFFMLSHGSYFFSILWVFIFFFYSYELNKINFEN